MKTEEQIRDEIEATNQAIANYRNAYKDKKISKNILKIHISACYATLSALSWVLGENDRYD